MSAGSKSVPALHAHLCGKCEGGVGKFWQSTAIGHAGNKITELLMACSVVDLKSWSGLVLAPQQLHRGHDREAAVPGIPTTSQRPQLLALDRLIVRACDVFFAAAQRVRLHGRHYREAALPGDFFIHHRLWPQHDRADEVILLRCSLVESLPPSSTNTVHVCGLLCQLCVAGASADAADGAAQYNCCIDGCLCSSEREKDLTIVHFGCGNSDRAAV